ncbi:hypothetical protein CgS9114_12347 [Corynebacterium glutamicum S9114]|nr:hypothetical protein CgS9114_12347 [Corynebacterium glutamicum S9114]
MTEETVCAFWVGCEGAQLTSAREPMRRAAGIMWIFFMSPTIKLDR